jgi:hypothetical protein
MHRLQTRPIKRKERNYMKRFYMILLALVMAVALIVPFAAPAMACTQGCTPGYWKNNALNWEAVSWGPTGYLTTATFDSVFARTITIKYNGADLTNPTLLEALQAKGGGFNNLARQGVAALLNAAHPGCSRGH